MIFVYIDADVSLIYLLKLHLLNNLIMSIHYECNINIINCAVLAVTGMYFLNWLLVAVTFCGGGILLFCKYCLNWRFVVHQPCAGFIQLIAEELNNLRTTKCHCNSLPYLLK